MAQEALDLTQLPQLPDARIAILLSKWYPKQVKSMCAKCVEVLRDCSIREIDTHTLPGTFEFPYAAGELAVLASPPDAIICFSVVLKGDTMHFEMIIDECVRGLGEVSREHRIPIINEILPVTDIGQADSRSANDDFNKGIEAAVAAIEILHWRAGLGVSDNE